MTKTKSTYLALLAVLLSPLTANADLIVISGAADSANDGEWDMTFITGSFASVREDLADQIWWENSDLAELFANTLLDTMGLPNSGTVGVGPIFAYCELPGLQICTWVYFSSVGLINNFPNSDDPTSYTWAIADRVSVPEPGTLALLGIGLVGMGLVRRRSLALDAIRFVRVAG
jgi:hypothetical protein